MVRKQDQEHIKALLTEAITVLCTNGLGFESQLNIEALIGITLDKDEVFLVKIDETVNARNTRDSSVLELSCEDVCDEDRQENIAETQVTPRPKIGPASYKRLRAQKRKHSSSTSSGSDLPSEMEKVKGEKSPTEKYEPARKRVQSASPTSNSVDTDNQKKTQPKDLNKFRPKKEESQTEQDKNHIVKQSRVPSEERREKSTHKHQVQFEVGKSPTSRHNTEEYDRRSKDEVESNKKHSRMKEHEYRKVSKVYVQLY